MIDFKRISASFELNPDFFKDMSPENKKHYIRKALEKSFANFFAEHFEDIPRLYNILQNPDTMQENHTVYLNLISDDEIRRLRIIEDNSKITSADYYRMDSGGI